MSSLAMNGATRSRTVLTLLAFFGATLAFAQPTELPNRRDVLEGITTAGVSYANASALDKLLAEAPKPVLLHCASGNRAGALLALRAKIHGADASAALELGVATGLGGLRPVVEQKLAAGHD